MDGNVQDSEVIRRVDRRVDNALYEASGDQWWQPDAPLHLLKTTVNPVRVKYFKRKVVADLKLEPRGKAAVEVGCGGGIMCEEIARMGFAATGVDPAAGSVRTAAAHARAGGLSIEYLQGWGEALPCRNESFDVAFCCDVLEHVDDPPRVIAEIGRVLKPGGIFCYDTLNRTLLSRLVAISIAQNWRWSAFLPPELHVWSRFIKPTELRRLLEGQGLQWQEHRGVTVDVSVGCALWSLYRHAQGKSTYRDLGEKLVLRESGNLTVMYMGYALKPV